MGRYVILDITIGNLRMTLGNVYGPNEDEFFQNVADIIENSPGAIVKNQAPHVNFCYSVVLRSYRCRVSEKSGWHFFKQCSRSFGGH